MEIKPIRSEADHTAAMKRVDQLWGAPENTIESDELEVLLVLIESYEEKHVPMPPSNPVEAIKFMMGQQGLTRRDLEQYIGPSGRVSEVLNGDRPLSIRMIKRLHEGLRIPYESLLAGAAC